MTGKKERRSRFGGMGSVLAQHRLLDAALGPGEGAVDASPTAPDVATETTPDSPPRERLIPTGAPAVPPAEDGPAAGTARPTTADAARPSATRSASPNPTPTTGDSAPPRSHRRQRGATTPSAPASTGATSAPDAPAPDDASPPVHAAPPAPRSAPLPPAVPVVERLIEEVRPSPFQPRGRPSRGAVDAVRRAVGEAGSLDALVGTEGAVIFARLDGEAARLAELAFDIAEHGVKEPIVTRVAEDGAEECLSGHRRLAAARLAGLTTVPVLSRGAMSNAHAAATVLSGNLHREAFTTWQEAVLVSEVRERRLAEQMPADVRTLSRVMGWASGKAQARLKLRRVLSDALLEQLGDAALIERIGRVGTKELNRIADAADDGRRLALLRRALGVVDSGGARVADAGERVVVQRPRRGGGFVLEVRREIESMPLGDLAIVRELLEAQLARVTTRMTSLRRSS